MTASIGIRELRGDLAAHVRRAGAGQRVVVTVGDRPVATLGPVSAEGDGATTFDALVAAGLVVPPRRRGPAGRAADPVPVWSGVRLDRALRDLRG